MLRTLISLFRYSQGLPVLFCFVLLPQAKSGDRTFANAGISDAERCDYLTRYCCCDKSGFDHKRFIKGLKEHLKTDCKKLKAHLAKCYPPEEEEFSITQKALVKFIQWNRNIHNLVSFDEYYRNFGLLVNALEAKEKLKKTRGIPYLSMAYRTHCARK